MKRGIHRPSRCSLCLEQEETSQHLFLECSLTKKVWRLFLGPIGIKFILPGSFHEMAANWRSSYLGKLGKKWTLGGIQNAALKNIWLKVWLARNKFVFNSKKIDPQCISFKATNLIKENLSSKQVVLPNTEKLNAI